MQSAKKPLSESKSTTYQHYVPRFHLKRFLSKNKKLYIYSKNRVSSGEEVSPKKIMGERGFYHYPESEDNIFDELHSCVEANQNLHRALSIIKNSKSSLAAEEKEALYRYINNLSTRTVSSMTNLGFLYKIFFKILHLDKIVLGDAISKVQENKQPNEQIYFTEPKILVRDKSALQPMSLGFFDYNDVMKMKFRIFNNKNKHVPFVISDNPVITAFTIEDGKFVTPSLILPLSKTQSIAISSLFKEDDVVEINDDDILTLNEAQVINAYDIIATPKTDMLDLLVKKYNNTVQFFNFAVSFNSKEQFAKFKIENRFNSSAVHGQYDLPDGPCTVSQDFNLKLLSLLERYSK